MLFSGVWQLCDDGVVRPLIRGEIRAGDGSWRAVELLLDTGADRTVFSAHVLESLGLQSRTPGERLGGVGGIVEAVIVRTEIRLTREEDRKVVFRGEYAACTQQEMLDMSVLGRDILEMFAVVVDRPQDVVCLIGGPHITAEVNENGEIIGVEILNASSFIRDAILDSAQVRLLRAVPAADQ